MSSVKALTAGAIQENEVMVFSKSYCPYCRKAKDALSSLDIKFTSFELDEMKEGSAIQAELEAQTGQRTVPNVFVKGQHIGGADATLAKIASGEFQKLLKG